MANEESKQSGLHSGKSGLGEDEKKNVSRSSQKGKYASLGLEDILAG